MLAVAENGGRIRPQVTIVKALASAICIGSGGSVGREGPIVQIGSAFASTLGQLVRMSESRLRIIVACGAAGGIAATFNAPITGLFFGFEIVLREFSLDALFATGLAAVTGDLISRAFFGSAPFFSQVPHDLVVRGDANYLLIAVLGLAAGLVGVGFKTVLYGLEDRVDELWKGRPEWVRPAVGGIALGALLLALPQMYGVGYPVMDRVLGGHVVLWLIVIFMLGKILASSLTLSIGGSGGVFAPSLFTGAMGGMAFGLIARHIFGAAVGPAAMYAVVAMGGVFAGAAQAPLTAIASVARDDRQLHAHAADHARQRDRRRALQAPDLRQHLHHQAAAPRHRHRTAESRPERCDAHSRRGDAAAHRRSTARRCSRRRSGAADRGLARALGQLVGPLTRSRDPQVLFPDETLEQALRQLVLYGHAGCPCSRTTSTRLRGWVTRDDVMSAFVGHLQASAREIERGAEAAEFAVEEPHKQVHVPTTPLAGYEILEVTISARALACGRLLGEVRLADWLKSRARSHRTETGSSHPAQTSSCALASGWYCSPPDPTSPDHTPQATPASQR